MNIYERILKLLAAILKMVVDGARDPEKVAEALEVVVSALQAIVDEPVTVAAKVYLRRLFADETIPVAAVIGSGTFVSSGFFPGGVYGVTIPKRFVSTMAATAVVYGLTADGTFAEILGSLGEKRLRWKTEEQVATFCHDNPSCLSRTGVTFFEIEGGFVAHVSFGGRGRLYVYVRPFSRDDVWSARYRHRFVLPQQ